MSLISGNAIIIRRSHPIDVLTSQFCIYFMLTTFVKTLSDRDLITIDGRNINLIKTFVTTYSKYDLNQDDGQYVTTKASGNWKPMFCIF